MKLLPIFFIMLLFSCGEPRTTGECGVPDTQPDLCGTLKCEVHIYGEKLYKANCSSCHRITDQKLIGPGLYKYSKTKSMRKDFKSKCEQGNMPITLAEVDSIAAYIEEMQL